MTIKKFCVSMLAVAVLGGASVSALAAAAPSGPVGEVQQVSGTLSVQRTDGTVGALSLRSGVNNGDVLTTQRESYALIKMVDGSTMTLRPNSQLKIESYLFVQEQPQSDSAVFRLVKGGMRTITGLVGQRNPDQHRIGTVTGTIGIRGSDGDTQVVTGPGQRLDPGTYHYTRLCCFFIESGGVRIDIPQDQTGFSRGAGVPPTIFVRDPGLDRTSPPTRPFTAGSAGDKPAECKV